MVTDPRIVECARAMRKAETGREVTDEYLLGAATGGHLDLLSATACILKWLEQEATEAMHAAGFAALHEEHKATYSDYCAQARKEILE